MLEVEDGVPVLEGRGQETLRVVGVAGATTFRPATCVNQASTFWEWNGPAPVPPPTGTRTTTGTAAPHR